MNLYLRVLAVVAAAMRGRPLGPLDVSRLSFRTLPGDLDMNGHMNNGRYLTLMDLGRMDLCVRTGIARTLIDNRWKPIVASSIVRFRKSLHLGDRFDLVSQMLGWDQRSVYFEHRMEKGGQVHAIGVVRGLFAGPDGMIEPARLAKVAGYDGPSPRLPDAVGSWRDAEQDLLAIHTAEGNARPELVAIRQAV
jgi:acyl-CoA thioesterase FadM